MSPVEKNAYDFTNTTKALESAGAAATDFAQSMLGSYTHCQSEAAQLASRRARAWLELPEALSACRTMPEVARVQTDFVRKFWADWLGTGQRVAAIWTEVLKAQTDLAAQAVPEATRSREGSDEADPFAVWEWWRTDLKGIKPRRSDYHSPSLGRHGAH
jgi:hypothetical protein